MMKRRIDVASLCTLLLIFESCGRGTSQIKNSSGQIGCTETNETRTCYDYNSTYVDWSVAWLGCENMGGQLAILNTEQINPMVGTYITPSLQNDDLALWVGGRELNSSIWQWVTGETFQYGSISPNTVVNLNSQLYPFDTCAVVGYNDTSVLYFKSVQCNSRMPYICQRKLDSSPTSNSSSCMLGSYAGVANGSSCYAIVSPTNTWFAARSACYQMDADLAVFNESRDHDVIVSILKTGSPGSCWIGLQRYPWIWVTQYDREHQSVVDGMEMFYAGWELSYPIYNGKSCLAINVKGNGDYGWRNLLCNQTLPYICQKTTVLTTTTLTTTIGYTMIVEIEYMNDTKWSSGGIGGLNIANIVVPCAIVAAIFIIIGATLFFYFSKRREGYDQLMVPK